MRLKKIFDYFALKKKCVMNTWSYLRLDYYSFSDDYDWLNVDNIRISKAREENGRKIIIPDECV